MREVWFQAFDKKHGLRGEHRINQDALKEAILAHARSKRWKEPVFIDISDAYKHAKNRSLAEIDAALLMKMKKPGLLTSRKGSEMRSPDGRLSDLWLLRNS